MVFKGLYSLVKLDLCDNELTVLSSDVFNELHKLVFLNIKLNTVYDISSKTLASLHSLEYLYMSYYGSTLNVVMSEFHNLTSLKFLDISLKANVSNTTFYPLAGLPIQAFQCLWSPFVRIALLTKLHMPHSPV